jgi:hypothetical protein
MAESVEYLIPYLRLRIGDTNSTAYRYLDAWLLQALIVAIRSLERYWSNKYLVDEFGMVSRNSLLDFPTTEPPVIETDDEYPIVLKAALIVLEGNLENSAWDAVIWHDAEISYNSTDGTRIRNQNLDRLQRELDAYLLAPTRRLAKAQKKSMYGYKNNPYENKTEY